MKNNIIGIAKESVEAGDFVEIDMKGFIRKANYDTGMVAIRMEETKMKKNELVLNTKVDKKELMRTLEKEMRQEYQDKLKGVVKQKIKEIKMTELLLRKQKEELDAMLDGKKIITEEQLLFEE